MCLPFSVCCFWFYFCSEIHHFILRLIISRYCHDLHHPHTSFPFATYLNILCVNMKKMHVCVCVFLASFIFSWLISLYYICILGWFWGIFYRKVLFRKYSCFFSLLVHFFTFNKTVIFFSFERTLFYIYLSLFVWKQLAISLICVLCVLFISRWSNAPWEHIELVEVAWKDCNGAWGKRGEDEDWSRNFHLNWDWFDFISFQFCFVESIRS